MQYKILMVDDDLKNIKATKTFFEINGLQVDAVSEPDAVFECLKQEEYALILMDYNMPEKMGHELCAKIKEIYPKQQMAMYSCDLSREALKTSYSAGAIDFIEKSSDPDEILKTVFKYCRRYDEVARTVRPSADKSRNAQLLSSLGMVGRSEAMAEVAYQIRKLAAAGDVSVLVYGETGTGKELVAKALHRLSPRSKGPFVAINCAAIQKDLMESILFGHRKGAFTGAISDQEGKFSLAHGGTLFLDEIGDLSFDLQAKLLRVLQEREVEPLGSNRPKKIDVRLICATHKNLDSQVQKGEFREDLMYRIHVTQVMLPSLRDRVEDIEPLISHFTEKMNERYGFQRRFQHRTLEILKQYSWPGNIRELEGVVERHLIHCSENLVRPDDLDLDLYTPQVSESNVTLEQFEVETSKVKMAYILKVVSESPSKAQAARQLGVSPSHLQYLLNQSKASKSYDGLEKSV